MDFLEIVFKMIWGVIQSLVSFFRQILGVIPKVIKFFISPLFGHLLLIGGVIFALYFLWSLDKPAVSAGSQ